MGMETVLLGYVAEPWVAVDDARNRHFRESNRDVLAGLPQQDDWPPFYRSLFTQTELDPTRGGYRGGVIHFGGRFKALEEEWDERLVKFEGLLGKLFWESAVVHLHTEASGSYQFEWWVKAWDSLLSTPPRLPVEWEFRGPFRRWGKAATAGGLAPGPFGSSGSSGGEPR